MGKNQGFNEKECGTILWFYTQSQQRAQKAGKGVRVCQPATRGSKLVHKGNVGQQQGRTDTRVVTGTGFGDQSWKHQGF